MLVPRRPVTIGATALLGWWMIDPATGQLRDQLEDGRHAEFVKKEITEEPARIETPAYRRFFQKYGQCLRAAAVALDLMLESGGAGKAERAAQKLKDEMTQRSTPASGKGGGSCGPA